MIYRLRYCNKDGVEARVDIQKGLATPVIEVEGTERPFILSYNNDKGNKSGMFLSSSADIEIYETTDFNIDNLKTSNETELSVTHYIDNVVSWQGFIIPDFFSIEVRNNPVVVMTASDRLGTLKNVTLSDLPSMINIRELTLMCLNKTGLSLPLKTIADFSNDGVANAFFSYYVDSQRIKDIKGRSISCYDILSSILIASNSKLVQRAGEWVIINKLQHEIGSGKIYSSLSIFTNYLENIYNFEEVSIGARRTIMPVAGSVGIYHEHGGRKSHPANYDFSLDLSGWNSVNGFVATIENRHIIGFLGGTPLFDPEKTVKQYLLNYNNWIDNTNNLNTAPYISTDAIQINSPRADRVEVTVDISSIMAEKLSSNTAISFLRYAVILTNGIKTYTLTKAGIFEILDPENISGHSLLLRGGQQPPLLLASLAFSNSDSFKGLFEVGEDDDVNNYSATIRVYGSGNQYVTVNYALIKFSDVSELPKGTMYKTEQGEVFTKAYDIDTSIFGDYLLSGLDGYFYRYPNDDTSSIYEDINTLSTPVWTTPNIPNETSELPLLHHSMRQMRRMFSVAHDLLSAEIEVSNFDPLAVFVACGVRHTVVSAQFDFFKSNLSVELEEVAFQSATVRDYIYSYFGDGESGIKSIGGIAGGSSGGGGTGGGLTPEQLEILSWWKKDPDNPDTIFTEMNAYSKLELSAYGAGDGSGGGGTDYERLDGWADYDSTKADWVLSAFLGVDLNTRVTALNTRVTALEQSPGGGIQDGYWVHKDTGVKTYFGLDADFITDGLMMPPPWSYDCSEVKIPLGVTELDYYCFYGCSSLTSVTLPVGLTSLGDACFYGCTSLTSINIPVGVTSIGDECFSECFALTSITLPVGVTSLGDYCFWGCSSLTSITIPVGVTSLGDGCFVECHALTSINIPVGVTSLGSDCFAMCISLTSITIPESVISIGDYCFFDCSSLTLATVLPTIPPTLGGSAFDNVHSSFNIKVRSPYVDDYKTATNWISYESIISAI